MSADRAIDRGARPLWILWALALLALALRLAPLMRPGSAWAMANVDSPRYVELAQGLRAGCGFARLVDGHCAGAEVLRTPGYPLLLAAIPSPRMVVAVQALIGAALCLIVGYFVTVWWDLRAAAIAEAILALDLSSIVEGSRILSDVLFQALLACAVIIQLCVIARRRSDARALAAIFAAAALLTLAIIVRPVGLLLPILAPLPVLMLPAMGRRRMAAVALLAFALPALTCAGWAARNAARTGVWTLSTAAAIHLYYYEAGGLIWYRGHKDFPAVTDDLARRLGLPDARDYLVTPAALEPRMIGDAERILLHDPAGAVEMTLRSFLWLAVVPDRGSLNELLGTHAGATAYLAATGQLSTRIHQLLHSPLLTVLVTFQLALTAITWIGVAFALAAVRRKSAREVAVVLLPLGVALMMIALASGVDAYARYRMPAVPLLAILAGIGWSGAALRVTPVLKLGND